jgi:hypothetical protein
MAFVVSPATGSTVQEEHERVGAAGAVSARNEEAIGGAVQGAAQKTLFERLRGFTVGHGGGEHPGDEEKQRSRSGAPDGSHPLVSGRFRFLHTRIPLSADFSRRFRGS